MKFKKFLYKFNNRKKFLLIIVLLILALLSTFKFDTFVSASNSSDNLSDLSAGVMGVLDGVNLDEMQNLVDELGNNSIFNVSVRERIESILKGEYSTNYSSMLSAFLGVVFGNIKSVLPFIFTLVAIGLLSNVVGNLKSNTSGVENTTNFIFLSVAILVVLISFKGILGTTNKTLNSILTQMQIVFPILITLLGTIGSVSSISIYNPLVAILSTLVSVVFDKFLYPLFIIIFVLTILGNLTDTIKFDKLNGFLMSTFKWSIGIIFTLFTGFLSIQGITAGKFDSVSIKATKFAMKSYIPIIGSYVSDGMDFFVLGATLVKNSIGLVGVLILIISILSPIIMIIVYKLALQLSSGILQITGNSKICKFLGDCNKILILPIVLIIGVSFMYIITISLIMCTANIL
ncbi:MAG TPA: hypothetical protein DD614_03725 [Clostridiales bacterium]|nr:hypothetical protein [Clostridiales bacterium]